MGHNPSRQAIKALSAHAAYDVEQYKASAIWGLWRGLKADLRDRYFNADEIAWINRYGSRLVRNVDRVPRRAFARGDRAALQLAATSSPWVSKSGTITEITIATSLPSAGDNAAIRQHALR